LARVAAALIRPGETIAPHPGTTSYRVNSRACTMLYNITVVTPVVLRWNFRKRRTIYIFIMGSFLQVVYRPRIRRAGKTC